MEALQVFSLPKRSTQVHAINVSITTFVESYRIEVKIFYIMLNSLVAYYNTDAL